MNQVKIIFSVIITLLLMTSAASKAIEHKNLILTKQGILKIRQGLGKTPLFDATLKRLKRQVDAEIKLSIQTPIPVDLSGGYTHQRHKSNFFMLQKAGVLFQILEDEKYARYIRDMLFQYEAMYKDLPLHPQTRSYSRGKLFWQNLNDANWLVYASQGYDAIYGWLSKTERDKLENNLFRPFANHISIDSPNFFNRIHNHSTWGTAAVGMIGLVMKDEDLIKRALYGLPKGSFDLTAKDNDGGFIYSQNGKAGFLANIDKPFSPDGYYTEGPYYQRYAMYPFLIFSQALHNVKPELEIFKYNNGVLLKAVESLLNLTNASGEFFPLNDAQKGMSYQNNALVAALDLAYYYGDHNPRLLSIARKQGSVLLNDAGYATAAAIRDGKAKEYKKSSVNLSDGSNGNEGGLSILRYGDEELTLVFKYTAQGLSHGHYDKLSFSLYDHDEEILQDYGMSRFVNIGQKGGGNYLPENKTWAKQSIAHNTLIQNETSHFKGLYELGSKHHSELRFFDPTNKSVQVVSAVERNAYPGTVMLRTLAMIKDRDFDKPFVLDLFKIKSDSSNQYDLPYYYFGQVLHTNFKYTKPETLQALGKNNGYQHLYLEAVHDTEMEAKSAQFSWMNNRKFHTLTTITHKGDKILLTRLGANDPDFNLRNDPAIILRRKNVKSTLFGTIIEQHGNYNPVSESAFHSNSNIETLTVLLDDADYTAVMIKLNHEGNRIFIVSNQNNNVAAASHQLKINGKKYSWVGPFLYDEI